MDSSPTWGITGPAFLAVFMLVGVLLAGVALYVRRRAAARLPEIPELHGYVLTLLNPRYEWENDVVVASLVLLRSKGLVEVEHAGTLRPTGEGEDLTVPLDRAVLQGVADGKQLGELKHHHLVETELFRLRRECWVWGQDVIHRHRARMWRSMSAILPLGLLLLLGMVRLLAGAENGEPVGLLKALLLLLGAGILALSWWWVPRRPLHGWAEKFQKKKTDMVEARLREPRPRRPQDGFDPDAHEIVLRTACFGPVGLADVDPGLDAVVKADAPRLEAEKADARRREEKQARTRRRRFGRGGGSSFSSGFSYGRVVYGDSSYGGAGCGGDSGGGGGGGGCGG